MLHPVDEDRLQAIHEDRMQRLQVGVSELIHYCVYLAHRFARLTRQARYHVSIFAQRHARNVNATADGARFIMHVTHHDLRRSGRMPIHVSTFRIAGAFMQL